MKLEDNNIENEEFRDADYFAKKAHKSNKNKLSNIFKMIDAASENGDYSVTLTRNFILNEDQVNFLEDLNFDIQESEDPEGERINIINFEQ